MKQPDLINIVTEACDASVPMDLANLFISMDYSFDHGCHTAQGYLDRISAGRYTIKQMSDFMSNITDLKYDVEAITQVRWFRSFV